MINVILADHERIYRIGMASALAAEDDIRIVGQPTTFPQLMTAIQRFRPHVVILSDLFLRWIDSIRGACESRHTAMMLLADFGDTELPQWPLDFHAIVRRATTVETVVNCVRHLARGGRVVHALPVKSSGTSNDHVGMRVRQKLTIYELSIVSHVVQGYRNREIALRLGTTEQSIKNALRKIFDKTGVYGRLELALFVLHHRTLADASAATQGRLGSSFLTALEDKWGDSVSRTIH
jgi:DNA-binding NarL/FixJ family response regulator